MKIYITIVAAFAATCVAITQATGSENLVKNPDLSSDTAGWETMCMPRTDGASVRNKEANFISHVADQGAAGTQGCLKVSTKLEEGTLNTTNNTGACASIVKVSGSDETPARVKVTFYAKSADHTTEYLYIGRVGGGGNKHALPITSDWQKFEVEISAPYPISGIIFCPTNKIGKDAVNGEVLLDEVAVEDLGPISH
ncbi:MAG: hypothetical protein WCO94_08480 [Verrucomicrobiota bacterium]